MLFRSQLNPTDVRYWQNLGAVLAEKGEFSQARSCLEHALALDPGHPTTYANLLKVYQQMGDQDSSMRLLEEAQKRFPKDKRFP